jgi:CRP-like cAMP-binding protein
VELAATELFGGLPEGECRRLRGLAAERAIAAGEVVVEDGRQANAFYLIVNGRADVVLNEQAVASRRAGEWFGEAALLGGGRRHGSVVAADDLTVLVWPGDQLREVLARNPEVLQRVLETVRRRAAPLV